MQVAEGEEDRVGLCFKYKMRLVGQCPQGSMPGVLSRPAVREVIRSHIIWELHVSFGIGEKPGSRWKQRREM